LILAAPHRLGADRQPVLVERYPLAAPDPAGTIHSSAADLAKYLRFQLGDGTWQGKRLISAENLAEPRTPQIVLRVGEAGRRLNPDTVQMSYGMGWIVQDYRGHGMTLHGGVINGFRSQLTLIPKARLGIALLNNLDHTYMNYALSNQLVDLMLGLPYRDWTAVVQNALAKTDEEMAAETKAFHATRKKGTRSTLPLDKYVGRYEDAAYGPCSIAARQGKLIWEWNKFRVPLEHFHDDVFLGTQEVLLIDVPFTFQVKDQHVESFRALERTFRRVAEKK
jgi:hypothetical protein